MIPENITDEHIKKAIQEIDAKGIRKGRQSSTYDLLYDGKKYPPKLVLSIANRFINGVELSPNEFEGGKDTEAFNLLKKEGFEIIPKLDPIKSLIEKYKNQIETTQLKDELYKWKLIHDFKGWPDVNAPDFHNEVKKVRFNNLIYAMAGGVLNHIAREKPEELRLLFKDLFNENTDLPERIKHFNSESLVVYRTINNTMPHHQDERTIAAYLTYHDPEKYTFYKSSYYKKYCNLLGIEEAKSNEKYSHYLELIDQIIEDYIKPNDDLISKVKELIPEYYDGVNHKLLAQDILYQMLDKEASPSYWIFQGNPEIYNVVAALNANAISTWSVKAHKDKIKTGDKFILWLTGKNSGCYALGEVISDVYKGLDEEQELQYYRSEVEKIPSDKVKIQIAENLAANPITKERVNSIIELSNLKVGNQGTNFASNKEEYSAILQLLESASGDFSALLAKFKKEDLDNYFGLLKEIIAEFILSKDDVRLVFSTSGDNLNFTVGQRYCLNLYLSNSKGKFGVISMDKLLENSSRFQGVEPLPYYSYFNVFSLKHEEKKSFLKAIEIELNKTSKSSFRQYNNIEFENYVFGHNTQPKNGKMNLSLNTILYGPPGTGKTYNSIDKAVEITSPENYSSTDHKTNKIIFDELRKSGQIEFLTFHQNYSYEDFMVGIRPDAENELLRFKAYKGIFYEIAKRARENYYASKEKAALGRTFDEVFNEIVKPVVEGDEEVEITMLSGVKFKIIDVSDTTIHFAKPSGGTQHTLSIQTLEDIVEGIKVVTSGLAAYYNPLVNLIQEKRKPTAGAKVESLKKFVLIIDEINRANISKVFGELITLLEDDKRIGEENELKITLPNGEKEFGVPPNLYLIGTMNTADKSIALIDIALRRRFEFLGYYPKYEGYSAEGSSLLRKINEAIFNEKKSADYLIGHAYFMNSQPIETILRNKVIPLLTEYFSNKTDIVSKIFTDTGWNVSYDSTNYNWNINKA